MRQSWSPRWRGQLCRPVVEDTMAIRLDWALRAALTNADETPQPISRAWYRGELLIATSQISVIRLANRRVAVQFNMHVGAAATTEIIDIDWSNQRLGGRRAWWCCPGCRRRCGVLFNVGGAQWRCRHCLGMTYQSSNCSDRRIGRLLGRSNLAAELQALNAPAAIGSLVLHLKTQVVLRRRARRNYRRWFRKIHPRRHLPRELRYNRALGM